MSKRVTERTSSRGRKAAAYGKNLMPAKYTAVFKASSIITATISLALILSLASLLPVSSVAAAQLLSQSAFQIGNDMSMATTTTGTGTDFAITNNSLSNVNLSGKVASAIMDLANQNVTTLLFGNWSLSSNSANGTTFFTAFTMHQLANTTINPDTTFKIENLKANSFQKINNNIVLSGTTNVSSAPSKVEGTENTTKHSWNNAKTTISVIANKTLLITFDKSETTLNEIFNSQPIIGMVVS